MRVRACLTGPVDIAAVNGWNRRLETRHLFINDLCGVKDPDHSTRLWSVEELKCWLSGPPIYPLLADEHMAKKSITKPAVAAGAILAAGVLASAAMKNWSSLRGWAFYYLVKAMAPDLSDPAVLKATIEKDRAEGPKLPPRKLLAEMDVREVSHKGMRVFRATRKGAQENKLKLLYLHGGAYVLDLQEIQWNLVAGLLKRVDAEIFVPIYPLGPEASWRETTAAVRDYYLALAEKHGAQNIMVCGDSAGGGLALLLAQAMRDEKRPQPQALILFSPALDISGSGPDQRMLEQRDPALSLRMLQEIQPMWLKGLPPQDPRVSPLFAAQDNLAPTILFSGDRDILHSDALRLKALNPAVDHRSYPEMMHVWPLSPLHEAKQALDEAATFIRQHSVP